MRASFSRIWCALRQDAVDEFAGEPRVADRIEQFGEALRGAP